jgi:hypothetical protein
MSATTDIQVWEFPLDWSKVREFANAVHDDHWNEEPLAVPPTLLVMLSAEHLERLILETLHLDRRRAVHGEHEYNFSRLPRVGERIQCRARVVEDGFKEGRRGGKMRMVVCETEFRDAVTGGLIGIERMTTLETAPQASP